MSHDDRLDLTIADMRKITDDNKRIVQPLGYERRWQDEARGLNHDSVFHIEKENKK